jgi:hypothetical protein
VPDGEGVLDGVVAVSLPDGDAPPETVVLLGVTLPVFVDVGFGLCVAVRLARGVLDCSGAVVGVRVSWVFVTVAGGGRTSR